MIGARRNWCLPCRELTGTISWAQALGVACEWHWGILSDADQAALAAAVREKHPRGGSVRSVIGQIWVVRKILRETPNTVVETWKRDAAEFLAGLDE